MNKLVWLFCFIAAVLGMVAFVLSLSHCPCAEQFADERMAGVGASPMKEMITDNINPVLMIISCEKNKKNHKAFVSKPNTFVVVGNPKMSEKYKIEIKNNIKYLRVMTKDIYFSLPAKIIMAIEAFNNMKEFAQYSHFYKIDDDCQIDWKKIKMSYPEGFLNHIGKNQWAGVKRIDHTGYISNCSLHKKYAWQDPDNFWATNSYRGNGVKFLRGSNYCIARDLANKINNIWHSDNLDLLLETEVAEDVTMAKVCFLLNKHPTLIPNKDRFVVDEYNNM